MLLRNVVAVASLVFNWNNLQFLKIMVNFKIVHANDISDFEPCN